MNQSILRLLAEIIKPLGALAVFAAFLVLQAGGFAGAAEVVVKETSRITSADPVSSSDLVEPTAPFAGGNERKAAHTTMVGEDPAAPSIDVINYALAVGEKTPSHLTLNATLSKPEDRAVLDRLAGKIYNESKGMNYEQVVINWHMGAAKGVEEPWARTTMTKAGLVGFSYMRPAPVSPASMSTN